MTPAGSLTVFVIGDDALVRASGTAPLCKTVCQFAVVPF
jgi:hypothetical protein